MVVLTVSYRKDIGNYGEDLAVAHLQRLGLTILERNWRYSRAEIDIIAKENDILVFIEVKTRSSDHYGKPGEFFTREQEDFIIDAAGEYMEQTGHDWEIRFDVISILLKRDEDFELRHYRDVFFPGIGCEG